LGSIQAGGRFALFFFSLYLEIPRIAAFLDFLAPQSESALDPLAETTYFSRPCRVLFRSIIGTDDAGIRFRESGTLLAFAPVAIRREGHYSTREMAIIRNGFRNAPMICWRLDSH
jgi:hypothetical protein